MNNSLFLSLGALANALVFSSCSNPSSNIDMKTDVEVVSGAEPMKLGEVLIPAPKMQPATLLSVPNNKNCNLVRGGAVVANITGYEGDSQRVPLFFVKERSYREDSRDMDSPVHTAFSLKRADITNVIVTQTDKPVNLLLTTHDANLWVIHKAPNVEIAAINVMSYEGGAVIAPSVDPSRIKFIVNNEGTRRCWKKPQRYTNAKEKSAVKPANYTRKPEDYERYRQEEKTYNEWLRWVGQKVGRVGHAIDREYRIEAALVGPPPVQPVAATPLGGQIIVDHSRHDNVFWGSQKEAEKKFPPPPKRR